MKTLSRIEDTTCSQQWTAAEMRVLRADAARVRAQRVATDQPASTRRAAA